MGNNNAHIHTTECCIFKVGTKVKHAKFGEGIVTKLENKGRIYIDVKFDKVGNMTLLLDYAPIEPI